MQGLNDEDEFVTRFILYNFNSTADVLHDPDATCASGDYDDERDILLCPRFDRSFCLYCEDMASKTLIPTNYTTDIQEPRTSLNTDEDEEKALKTVLVIVLLAFMVVFFCCMLIMCAWCHDIRHGKDPLDFLQEEMPKVKNKSLMYTDMFDLQLGGTMDSEPQLVNLKDANSPGIEMAATPVSKSESRNSNLEAMYIDENGNGVFTFFGRPRKRTAEERARQQNLVMSFLWSSDNCTNNHIHLKDGDVQFDNRKQVGKGHFGKIILGTYHYSRCAMKVMEGDNLESYIREGELIFQASFHPNICRFYGIYIENDITYLVMEYYEDGSIVDAMEKQNFNEQQKLLMCMQLAVGTYHLKSKGICHGDIGARNCLLNLNNRPLRLAITDFGLSCTISSPKPVAKIAARWASLEYIQSKTPSFEADCWAVGCTFVEIFNDGERPYGDMRTKTIIKNLLKGNFHPKLIGEYPITKVLEDIFSENIAIEEVVTTVESIMKDKYNSADDLEKVQSNTTDTFRTSATDTQLFQFMSSAFKSNEDTPGISVDTNSSNFSDRISAPLNFTPMPFAGGGALQEAETEYSTTLTLNEI